MDLLGQIVIGLRSSGFTRQQWIQLIREHPNLVIPPPQEIINPFTKERITIPARLDGCDVVIDDKKVGYMSWAEDDSILINVFGDTQAIVPTAHNVAESLGGCFRTATED